MVAWQGLVEVPCVVVAVFVQRAAEASLDHDELLTKPRNGWIHRPVATGWVEAHWARRERRHDLADRAGVEAKVVSREAPRRFGDVPIQGEEVAHPPPARF